MDAMDAMDEFNRPFGPFGPFGLFGCPHGSLLLSPSPTLSTTPATDIPCISRFFIGLPPSVFAFISLNSIYLPAALAWDRLGSFGILEFQVCVDSPTDRRPTPSTQPDQPDQVRSFAPPPIESKTGPEVDVSGSLPKSPPWTPLRAAPDTNSSGVRLKNR